MLNGKPQTSVYRKAVAYVHQDDALYGTLTVQECVEYSAFLRLPRSMKKAEKQAHVWKTLQELHLDDIAHNYIGNGGKTAGVSGGEVRVCIIVYTLKDSNCIRITQNLVLGLQIMQRKRVSVGMELVAQVR